MSFSVAKAGHVTLSIYDARGRLVRVLADASMTEGMHRLDWDGTSTHGETMPNGTYWIRLRTLDATVSRRISMVC